MIEAVQAVTGGAAWQPATEPSPVSLQQPTAAEATDFARALGGAMPLEARAAPPDYGDGLSARLSTQMDRLSGHLQALGPGTAERGASEVGGPPHTLDNAREQMSNSVAQIERAYMFAIETTMASRGSTETTKIFNTLLKGQ